MLACSLIRRSALEHDLDDPIPVESCYWGFWNRFAEDYMRLARLFGLIALLIALGLPQPAKAQSAASGVVCDTPDQMRRFVLGENAPAALSVINAEQGQSCAVMSVSFFVGSIEATIVAKDGVWEITHVLIVGIITHGGIRPVPPTPRWIAVAVASKPA
jgi:hypothetical protein